MANDRIRKVLILPLGDGQIYFCRDNGSVNFHGWNSFEGVECVSDALDFVKSEEAKQHQELTNQLVRLEKRFKYLKARLRKELDNIESDKYKDLDMEK